MTSRTDSASITYFGSDLQVGMVITNLSGDFLIIGTGNSIKMVAGGLEADYTRTRLDIKPYGSVNASITTVTVDNQDEFQVI